MTCLSDWSRCASETWCACRTPTTDSAGVTEVGFLTIGVISTGQCMLFGHGPSPSSLMSGPAGAFSIVLDPAANLAKAGCIRGRGRLQMPSVNLVTSVNLVGYAEHPVLGESPYRVDRDGASYVPVGDGGIVLGLELGDSVFKLAADHAAPGACLTHPDAAARHALAVFACVGNRVVVRTGPAAGAIGNVIGKRGEAGARHCKLGGCRPGGAATVRRDTRPGLP